jgi:subtilisin family serine protease
MSRHGGLASKDSALALGLAVAALALAPAGAFAQTPAPVTGTGQPGVIPGQYIVVMKSSATDAAKERTKNKARARGGHVNREYGRALKGYAAALPPAALADVRSDPDVAYVEADAVVTATATQSGPPWGLDRIDQRDLPLSASYTYTPTGAGVKAYIIDTGIRFSHQEFGGRATSGYDAVDGGTADDCNGHGTHVSGTVGGSTYGVAKQVTLVAVRVLDCSGSGTTAGVIAGINWVTTDHLAGQPAVANMSLGGGGGGGRARPPRPCRTRSPTA